MIITGDSYGPSPVSGGAPSPPIMIEGPRRPPSAPVGRRIEPYGESKWISSPTLIAPKLDVISSEQLPLIYSLFTSDFFFFLFQLSLWCFISSLVALYPVLLFPGAAIFNFILVNHQTMHLRNIFLFFLYLCCSWLYCVFITLLTSVSSAVVSR